MKGASKPRFPAIDCPHCGSRAEVRSSEKVTPCIRDVWLRCRNDDCGHRFVAQFSVVRTITPSLRPNPSIVLPVSAAYPLGQRRPANDEVQVVALRADNDLLTREIG
ncbi:ogr/Delta-like zinc finger family protein [Sphingomonas jatrophae]|uniref:Ogr/Delta-like zinc finger n=1 Tax=Sphingomonas jatrophae TaxID=1166337 RepID=A0A1I6JL74_9SPHN|nr:ogr/Delta-like zinc finger family protein [Sphingomonas jatrophae]SFR79725.1 Ogr/Delta-like zinc finger [Sphingomonas jatrophae]